MEIIRGRIADIGQDGVAVIETVLPNIERAIVRKYDEVQIGLPDARTISPEQRRKTYALMNEIADWIGDSTECVKGLMKMEFVVNRMQAIQKKMFSLSDCDMTTAREFITYLIDFMVEHGVPSSVPLYLQCEDIGRYVWACLMNKQCVICGERTADMHHCGHSHIGMGRNRDEIGQIGMWVMPLCREHHSICHSMSEAEFMTQYHLEAVQITMEVCKFYKMPKANQRPALPMDCRRPDWMR